MITFAMNYMFPIETQIDKNDENTRRHPAVEA